MQLHNFVDASYIAINFAVEMFAHHDDDDFDVVDLDDVG
jgi:hypothetical protein